VTELALLDESFAEPSLPRTNGVTSFEEPWQARALALAVLSVDRAGSNWDEFRRKLISAVAADENRPYWDCWLTALEEFVDEVGLI
jgi:hypothetical protein